MPVERHRVLVVVFADEVGRGVIIGREVPLEVLPCSLVGLLLEGDVPYHSTSVRGRPS